jgi:hypothetical protein
MESINDWVFEGRFTGWQTPAGLPTAIAASTKWDDVALQ